MIAKLSGKVIDIFPGYVILDVAGVGYKVEGFFNALEGRDIELFIHTHVREQEIRLFGFVDRKEFVLFDLLIQVSGVGPKAALSLLENVGQGRIYESLQLEDASMLKAPGVGRKTSEKIIIDLRQKVGKLGISFSDQSSNRNYETIEETKQALIGLGYNIKEIDLALEKIDLQDKTSSELIKVVLKHLSK